MIISPSVSESQGSQASAVLIISNSKTVKMAVLEIEIEFNGNAPNVANHLNISCSNY
jgi:hypothetical protein